MGISVLIMNKFKKIGGIIIRDKKILVVRKKGTDTFIIPGGRVEKEETSEQTLKRELFEELKVKVLSLKYFGVFTEPAAFEKDTLVELEIYNVMIIGEPLTSSEIKEYKWVDNSYKDNGIKLGSVLEKYVLPKLAEQGLIK